MEHLRQRSLMASRRGKGKLRQTRYIVLAPLAGSVCTMTLEKDVPFCTKSLPTSVVRKESLVLVESASH